MLYELKNEHTKAVFSDFGGEMHEMTVDGTNYIWCGDENYWKFHAPVLFPIVGRLNEPLKVSGCEYEINTPHGFGRTSVYEMTEQTENTITFNLMYSEETLKCYPYKFDLKIKYELIDKTVKIYYIVENIDNQKIYFSIGAHTALNCPFDPSDSFTDCYFEFKETETASRIVCDEKVLVTDKRTPYLQNEKIINIDKKLFVQDAIMFDDVQSDTIYLKSKNAKNYVEFGFGGFPFVALWSPQNDGPFVCIEPWHGLPDKSGFTGDISEKIGIIELEVGGIKELCHMITVHS